jgi:hypothetical protein
MATVREIKLCETVLVCITSSANPSFEMTCTNGGKEVWVAEPPNKNALLDEANSLMCGRLKDYLNAMELGSTQELTFKFLEGGVREIRPDVHMEVVKTATGVCSAVERSSV